MKYPGLLTAALTVALVGGAGAASHVAGVPHVRHEARDAALNSRWIKAGIADPDLVVPIHIHLAQSNLEHAEALLMDISNPSSLRFAHHLSAGEVNDLFAPTWDRIDEAKGWLSPIFGDDALRLARSRQWIHLNATVSQLEVLLQTEYYEYRHVTNGEMHIGCDQYHVPEHIQEHIDFITPGVHSLSLSSSRSELKKKKRHAHASVGLVTPKTRPMPQDNNLNTSGTSTCNFAITPDCIRALYNVTDTLKGNPNNSVGIYETYAEYWNQTDLNVYFKTFAPNIPQHTRPTFVSIDGAAKPDTATMTGDEPDLDMMAVFPLTYPDTVVNYEVNDAYYSSSKGEETTPGIFNVFLDAFDKSYCTYSAFGETGDEPGIDPAYPDKHAGGYNHTEQCGVCKPPGVIAISYSGDESDLPMYYQRRQCNEWMKLGLQGVSVILASGDTGVAPRDYGCQKSGNTTLFETQAPCNCPYVTVVGSTALPDDGVAGKTAETASSFFPTGGGFSNIFPQPAYQSKAVNSYFAEHPPPYHFYNITYNATHTHGRYNRGGRGYPDLAVNGQNFAFFDTGVGTLGYGTSISAPIFGSMIARINSFRVDAGKGPIGFLNSIMYQHPEVFNDITVGSNPGCGVNGFDAVTGWDPVTGLGTPDYGKLKELLMGI